MDYNLISHSQELNGSLKLWDHLSQVINAAESIVSLKSLSFSGISKQQIINICRITAACHDFEKSTSFFQDYINSKSENRDYEGDQLEKSHALISAFFGYNLAEKWLLNNKLESHWNAFIPFAVFAAIEGHHTTYKSIDEIIKRANENFDLIEKQIANVNPEIFEYKFLDSIDLSTCRNFNIELIDEISGKLRKFGRDYRKVPKGSDRDKWLDIQIEHRILALFLYSALLEADKAYLASDNPNQYDRKPIPISIPGDLVDKYIDRISDNKLINVERAKAYRDVIQSIERIPLDQRIHSVTLPTGLGKTLLSASWALKLRNRIEKEWNFSPKIIVSLPFLSIIEQTDEEYKQFLKEIYAKYGERLYFSSYSISDFRYRDGVDDLERSESSIDFFLGIWNAEMIITTYDQLLYSIFSLKPKYLMRFHNLINSIIIFDEVQALPSELWIPFEKFFSKLAEVGKSHILLMSATQPGFMPEAIERVPDHKDYFKRRNRVQL